MEKNGLLSYWPWQAIGIGLILILIGFIIGETFPLLLGVAIFLIGGFYLWIMAMIVEPSRVKTPPFTVKKHKPIRCASCGGMTEEGSYCKHCGKKL